MNENEIAARLKLLIGMSASEFVLHREPMLFLERLIDIGPDFASCEWHINEDLEFCVPDVGVPSYAGVEYMAQCVAVHAGARARIRGYVPPLGFLLGTRHYQCSVSHFEPGVSYLSTCKELVRDSQGMGSFACRIESNSSTIAEANLAVLERPQEIKLDE